METINQQINEADSATKNKSIIYADKSRGAKQSKMKVGDQVLVLQRKWNKLTSKFKPKPCKIIAITGTMGTACRKGHQITRNCSFFKTFRGHAHDDSSENDDDSGVNVAREDAPATPDRPEAGPVENQNDPAAQKRREVNEPVEDHLQREQRYPQRRRNRPQFYSEEQNI